MPHDVEANLALQKLRQAFPEAIEEAQLFRDEVTIYIAAPHFLRVAEFLRDDPALQFSFLADVTALDRYPQEPRFELVYQLLSMTANQRLRLKVRLSGDEPRFPSVVSLWPSANLFECEVFDLFGVVFEGHPFLRRLLMPEKWEGHPLRKDYPTEGYR